MIGVLFDLGLKSHISSGVRAPGKLNFHPLVEELRNGYPAGKSNLAGLVVVIVGCRKSAPQADPDDLPISNSSPALFFKVTVQSLGSISPDCCHGRA